MQAATVKCVLVGDGNTGKTSALITYTTNKYPTDYIPTVFDNYSCLLPINGRHTVCLNLWDTAGQEDYDRLRPLCYPQTDVFLVFFSVSSRNSFRNVKSKWCAELQHFNPLAKILLVGSKIDLRENTHAGTSTDFVSYAEGLSLAKEIGAEMYLECSALSQKGLKDVFDEAVKTVVCTPHKKKKQRTLKMKASCNIL